MNYLSPGKIVIDKQSVPTASPPTQALTPGQLPTASGMQSHHLKVGRLVALASGAIVGDPRSAEAYLRQAAALLGVPEGEPAIGTVPPPKGGTLAVWQVRRITEYIDLNIESPIRNRELARVVRLSVSHLSRAFKLTTGQSLHSYVVDRRVRHAKRLMTQSSDRLSDIACACGFADQAHLSRMFKRTVGESPAPWRRARERPTGSTCSVPVTGMQTFIGVTPAASAGVAHHVRRGGSGVLRESQA